MVNRGHGNGKLTAERESLRPIQAKIVDGIAGRITESQIHVKLDVAESNWPFFLVPVLLDWERVGGYNHRHWFRRSRSGGSGKCTRWIAQGIESDNYILKMSRMPTQLLDR